MRYFKLPTIDSIDIKFRTLTADESDKFYYSLKQENNPFIEEYIFNLITDNQYTDSNLSAGIVPLVVYCSFKLSGVILKKIDFPDKVDQYRDALSSSSYYPMYAKIVSTQPTLSLDILKTKTLNELIELITFSELIDKKPFFDTEKIREAIKLEESSKSNPDKKVGVKGITKEMLDSLKVALQSSEEDNF